LVQRLTITEHKIKGAENEKFSSYNSFSSSFISCSSTGSEKHSGPEKNEIENLLMGIRSDNPGLKKSAIYMSGKYEVSECSGVLIQQLKTEKDASVKVLIALALYRIGSEEGMEAIEELAHNDNNKEVRRMSSAIVNQWQEDNNNKTVVLR
jgi:hypothetical protein